MNYKNVQKKEWIDDLRILEIKIKTVDKL